MKAPARGMGPVLRFLRKQGVVPLRTARDGAVEALWADYRTYLAGQRGLANESIRSYVNQSRKFLLLLPEPLDESLARLHGRQVTEFVVCCSAEADSVGSAKALVTALRSLLGFLHVEGLIPVPLTAAVPGVAGWRLSALPRAMDAVQVRALLTACATDTVTGLRDHAVLTLLARLGLRSAEVAALELRDVDWRAGEIEVRGKGARVERLPLVLEVGEALAAYLTEARVSCGNTSVFVTARAPVKPLSAGSIRAIVRRACQRAGIASAGAHRLRHTLATDLLRAGASLTEIGQVLRHRSQLSTAVYAKVDHSALRALARPWPVGIQ